MKRTLAVALTLLTIAPLSFADNPDRAKDERARLQNAGIVMREIMNVPDDIPRDLLDHARCVIVMPSVYKAAFVVGGSFGRGAMVCRSGKDFTGQWGAPVMVALEGGSFGLQIGGEATDFVLLVMNDRGARSLMHSKVKLGGDLSIAAGPLGRDASADTDAYMRSEILSYSRTRGAFAGVSLEGSTLRPDGRADQNLYGRSVSAREIMTSQEIQTPEAAHDLLGVLQKNSPQRKA
ncbi:MAG: lipid-binding SYLF domain-containing protein [Candidatus Acidiferrales bacterium]